MKLTNIALYSNDREVAEFSFRDPNSANPYSAAAISGLDADAIVPKFYGTNTDGTAKYYNPSVGVREVALRITFDPQWADGRDNSTLRDDLYKAIASSRTGQVQLRFRDGPTVKAVANGFVSKFDTDHFSPTPAVNLSVRCEDGMLRALDVAEQDITVLSSEFSITDNESTAPHGLRMRLVLGAESEAFTISDDTLSDWSFTAEPAGGFEVNDVVYLSSITGDRYFYVERDDGFGGTATVHMADAILMDSHWPLVFPGPNNYKINYLSGQLEWQALEHYPTYWGV